ncbi:hypothetical protein IMZ31_01655 [Pontibacillus sp. ALD_SL1]|uniref:hypothetical protein n=1 Tax=Pontibacillus sp. ALD_SL1 TaxID=2777185 RepID=UPI001A962B23|nr:hypothetical protein [Pontibacillus sp. ALD_SL1]QST00332.1 hypothetical protein IMZ31_01655 [Pontibacillus sp. ALD_SL1]
MSKFKRFGVFVILFVLSSALVSRITGYYDDSLNDLAESVIRTVQALVCLYVSQKLVGNSSTQEEGSNSK